MDRASDLTPLVLLIDDQEWTSRSIESILRPKGHVVLKAYTGQQALDLVQKVSPDALIVDVHLPDIDGIDLVRQLRASPTIQSMTPILMITGGSTLAAGFVCSAAGYVIFAPLAAICTPRFSASHAVVSENIPMPKFAAISFICSETLWIGITRAGE